jgi:hypothetical protein
VRLQGRQAESFSGSAQPISDCVVRSLGRAFGLEFEARKECFGELTNSRARIRCDEPENFALGNRSQCQERRSGDAHVP